MENDGEIKSGIGRPGEAPHFSIYNRFRMLARIKANDAREAKKHRQEARYNMIVMYLWARQDRQAENAEWRDRVRKEWREARKP